MTDDYYSFLFVGVGSTGARARAPTFFQVLIFKSLSNVIHITLFREVFGDAAKAYESVVYCHVLAITYLQHEV